MYTGNTAEIHELPHGIPVYPCVYREHLSNPHLSISLLGLSLCIQGTLEKALVNLEFGRFIPVYTGNTTTLNNRIAQISVYPCVYREHIRTSWNIFNIIGLSLCIQGTLFTTLIYTEKIRFIPVYTGNTYNGYRLRCL